ncbi:DsbA family protein [Vitreimonas sp.]|uniref:DsbA family protein n=1 Tax=Vitreimonas sp. TaxID=3069702 RepID=UPI002ED9235F
MSQRTIVIVIAVIAVALFAGASFFYLNRSNDAPQQSSEPPITAPVAPLEARSAAEPPAETAAPSPAPEAEEAPAPRWNAYVRQHSPVIGPANARVTIVEFFDPACEACRAFYPIVHEIMRRHPNDVRLVLRYTPLHEGSEEAARILEAARMQNVFEPVLTSLFQQQPQWANHNGADLSLAWSAAGAAGLNVDIARGAMNARHINSALRQDVADAQALNVRGTPTFFVNERPLTNFGPQQLYDLVLQELEATQ